MSKSHPPSAQSADQLAPHAAQGRAPAPDGTEMQPGGDIPTDRLPSREELAELLAATICRYLGM